MRQSLFILILGFIAGVSYTQHDGFKSWVDDSKQSITASASDLFGDKKDDLKGAIKESFNETANKIKEKTSEVIEDASEQIEETKDNIEK